MILFIRTDSPVAVVGLVRATGEKVAEQHIELGRSMARDLPRAIENLLRENDCAWRALKGLAVFRGPGSFTGLRIGCSIANAVAYASHVPIVGTSGEEAWLETAVERLAAGENDKIVLPYYGAEARITKPRK